MVGVYFTQYNMLGIACTRSLNTHIILTHCDNPKHSNRFPNVTSPSLETLSIDMGCLRMGMVFAKAENRLVQIVKNLKFKPFSKDYGKHLTVIGERHGFIYSSVRNLITI